MPTKDLILIVCIAIAAALGFTLVMAGLAAISWVLVFILNIPVMVGFAYKAYLAYLTESFLDE